MLKQFGTNHHNDTETQINKIINIYLNIYNEDIEELLTQILIHFDKKDEMYTPQYILNVLENEEELEEIVSKSYDDELIRETIIRLSQYYDIEI